jgi:hypothetical protein
MPGIESRKRVFWLAYQSSSLTNAAFFRLPNLDWLVYFVRYTYNLIDSYVFQ